MLAKTPPAEAIEPLHTALEYALWMCLLCSICWVIFSGGHLAVVKFGGGSFYEPISRIIRSLIAAVLASSASGIAVTFLYATRS
ncbi:hypothetical protein [Nocardia salmonicida]|uniref:hypothetical protein n=1 Tax=Nocardia salmonicida TaxID=53431 RepID=UPI0034098C1A